jgi:Tol biopolymer transport system component
MAILLGRRHAGTWIGVGTLAKSDLAGGAHREILERVTDADISPDGSRFAVVREVGANQWLEFPIGRKILETSGWISHPRISPDGRRLAFLEHPAYGNDMGHVALADSQGRVTRLTDAWAGTQGLAWAPNGREIWFTATLTDADTARQDLRYKLYALVPGGRPRVVYAPPLDLWLADISSDGAVLLNALYNRSEIHGRLAGDTADRDLSTWSDEGAGGISDDGSIFAGIEQSVAGVGIDPFAYYRRAGDRAPVRIGNGTAWAVSPDGKWVLSTTAAKPTQIVLLSIGAGEPRVLPLGRVEFRGSAQRRASFSADGRLVLFSGVEPGRPIRLWLLDLEKGGPPRAVSPEGTTAGVISHDGRFVAALEEGKGLLLCAVAGGECSSVAGALPGDYPAHWDSGATGILVWDRTWPARIHRLDLKTGQRTLWKEIHPPDPATVLYGNILLARDGEHYVYRVRRISSQLYLAQGLK